MSIRQKKLPIPALERIDDLCSAFEQQWQSGTPPTIESFLVGDFSPEEHEVLLAELVVLEIDYRKRRGGTPDIQAYLDRFPEHADAIRNVLGDGRQGQPSFTPPSIEKLSELLPSLEILELLGAGGMGAVYKARQKGLDRIVALKVLPEEFSRDAKFALRFTREARTLARLNHPNIVSLFEFGNVQDTHYFLMEFVDGTTLRDVIQGGRLAPEQAFQIVPRLCDALQYAHDNGVIHRDIKPENILLGRDGEIKIADFGLSRLLDNQSYLNDLTRTHQLMGTPRYMAPEQLEGAAGIDHRADIYSLGVVFYEMLTGELPIGRFAAPSQKVEIDVRLDEVVLKTLEKEPQHRYQHASQIKSDVQSITSAGDASGVAATRMLSESHSTANRSPASTGSTAATVSTGSARNPSGADLQEQELAARLLLSRNALMSRVEKSLRPLYRAQIFQVFVGIALIALGIYGWAPHTDEPHRLVCGLVVHIYGILVIAAGAAVCTRINRIDYSAPVDQVRSRLDAVRNVYNKTGLLIGFPWWLMWIPVAVCAGFDVVVTQANSLIPSLIVGVLGMGVSYWLYFLYRRSDRGQTQSARSRLAGKSVTAAYASLEEIQHAHIG